MNSAFSPCNNDLLGRWLNEVGVVRFGVCDVGDVDSVHRHRYHSWIARGANGPLQYMERYRLERTHPRYLLQGAQSVISCAFPYFYPIKRDVNALKIARYALGRDYHDVLRERLTLVTERLTAEYGGIYRVCVDTAPLPERYWAVKSGIGFTGRNGQLYVPGFGSYLFLAEILSTTHFTPTVAETEMSCPGCGRCVKACPAKALRGDGSVDASRCHSCLSIEYRGTLPDGVNFGDKLYGCDVCADVCPLNRNVVQSTIEEFEPREQLLELTREDIALMDHDEYCRLFKGSAIKRAKLPQLKRNAI